MQSLPVNNTFLKIVAIMNYMNYDICALPLLPLSFIAMKVCV